MHAPAPAAGSDVPRDPNATRASILLRLGGDSTEREVAWQDFYARYRPVVLGFALRLGARSDEAEDVVQDVMVGFFGVVPRFVYEPARGSLRGYLKTCTLNALRKRLRARRLALSLEDRADDDPELAACWDDCWQEEQLGRAVERVRRHYASTPERQRTFEAFELQTRFGWPVKDVMVKLQMSEAAAHKANSRVRKRLRRVLEDLDALDW